MGVVTHLVLWDPPECYDTAFAHCLASSWPYSRSGSLVSLQNKIQAALLFICCPFKEVSSGKPCEGKKKKKHHPVMIFKLFPCFHFMLLQEVFPDFALKFGGTESASYRLCCEKEPTLEKEEKKLSGNAKNTNYLLVIAAAAGGKEKSIALIGKLHRLPHINLHAN